jgi:hypothetical protein
MKALTVRQPWASLIACGEKTIQTSPKPTSYRGPIAIHAGLARPVGSMVGPYLVCDSGSIAGYGLSHQTEHRPWIDLPLGAVVAVAELVDCAPIGGPTSFRTGAFEGDEGDFPQQPVVVHHPPVWHPPVWNHAACLVIDWPDRAPEDITGQLPFGDFTPGRWAWLFDNVRPLAEPVPMKGRQGLWTLPTAERDTLGQMMEECA